MVLAVVELSWRGMSSAACKHMELAARTREWGRMPNECQNGEKYWCERRICCEAVIEDREEGGRGGRMEGIARS